MSVRERETQYEQERIVEPPVESDTVRPFETETQGVDQTAELDVSPKRPFKGWIPLAALAVAGVLALIPFLMTDESAGLTDNIADSQRQEIQQAFDDALSKNTVFAESVELTEAKPTIEATFDAPVAQPIVEDAEQGLTEIVYLTVFDNLEQDGDVVRIANGLIDVTVPIWHAESTIPVPVSSSHPTVTLHALKDGGGGVTVGVKAADGTLVPIPPLPPGASVTLPVRGGS